MSAIGALKNVKVMAVDPSTNAIAFSVVSHKQLLAHGKIKLPKGIFQEKFKTINAVIPVLLKKHGPTHFIIEESIYIQNPNTSRSLAYINGCILSQVLEYGVKEVRDVSPLVWKAGIGYKKVSKQEKDAWDISIGSTESKKKAAFERKNRVKEIIDSFYPNNTCDDTDVSDAIGIGIWALQKWL